MQHNGQKTVNDIAEPMMFRLPMRVCVTWSEWANWTNLVEQKLTNGVLLILGIHSSQQVVFLVLSLMKWLDPLRYGAEFVQQNKPNNDKYNLKTGIEIEWLC